MIKKLTCIVCPMGCQLEAEVNDSGEVVSVTGNTCPRGAGYARSEIQHPVRTLTTTVAVSNRPDTMLPVKTSVPISKEKLFEAMAEVSSLSVEAPVKIGDVILANICGEADLVAASNID